MQLRQAPSGSRRAVRWRQPLCGAPALPQLSAHKLQCAWSGSVSSSVGSACVACACQAPSQACGGGTVRRKLQRQSAPGTLLRRWPCKPCSGISPDMNDSTAVRHAARIDGGRRISAPAASGLLAGSWLSLSGNDQAEVGMGARDWLRQGARGGLAGGAGCVSLPQGSAGQRIAFRGRCSVLDGRGWAWTLALLCWGAGIPAGGGCAAVHVERRRPCHCSYRLCNVSCIAVMHPTRIKARRGVPPNERWR